MLIFHDIESISIHCERQVAAYQEAFYHIHLLFIHYQLNSLI